MKSKEIKKPLLLIFSKKNKKELSKRKALVMPQLKTGEENMTVELTCVKVEEVAEVVTVVVTEVITMVPLNAITAKVKVICLMIVLSQKKKDLQDQ